MGKNQKKIIIITIVAVFVCSAVFGSVFGFLGGIAGSNFVQLDDGSAVLKNNNSNVVEETITVVNEESAIIKAVEKVSPAVVSIIVTKDIPIMEQYQTDPFLNDFFGDFFSPFQFNVPQERQNGTEKKEVGGGTGFIISEDGMIITNRHVVLDEDAEYTVLTNDGEKYVAEVLARDDTNDLAIMKIDKTGLQPVELGDSDSLVIGQTVIAIGNALGEFRNTVSVGVISGLSRSIIAGGNSGMAEQLSGVIQTDAAINPGNSGGPLLNIKGQVIGINTAIALDAQNIGFAIPINDAKADIDSVEQFGEIKKPFLGVRYMIINDSIKRKNDLDVNYGALVVRGIERDDLAVIPGSPADKMGIRENDIILEIDGAKIDVVNTVSYLIRNKKIGDKISLKILSRGEEKTIEAVLGERSSK